MKIQHIKIYENVTYKSIFTYSTTNLYACE